MKTILIIIMVANGRCYTETPQYVVEYPTEKECQTVAATYPTTGVDFQKAVCVPKIVLPNKKP